jgi:hypothetical protein
MILGFVFALVVAAPQHRSSTESQATMQQGAHDEYERHKQAAIRGLAEGRWAGWNSLLRQVLTSRRSRAP